MTDIFAATYEPAAAVPSAPVAPEPDGLRALSDAATAGPWEWVGDELVGAHDEADIEDYPDEDRREFVLAVQTFCGLPNPLPADAALIAAAVNYVRAALAAGVPSTPQAPDEWSATPPKGNEVAIYRNHHRLGWSRFEVGATEAEGLAHMSPVEFVEFWLKAHKHKATDDPWLVDCRRIEWRYLAASFPLEGTQA